MANAPGTPLFFFQQVFRRWKDFEGRAHRSEFWWFNLFNLLIGTGLLLLGNAIGLKSGLQLLYSLFAFIPALAVTVRRLHDTDRSGWWILIGLVPFVGGIVLLVFYCLDSTPGLNRFGPNPKGLVDPPAYQP